MSDHDHYVRIEYWIQETMESGRWTVTPPMLHSIAEMILSRYEQGTIVPLGKAV
jgi:hypothetical protein